MTVTLKEALNEGLNSLQNVPNHQFEAALLLAHVLQVSRSYLYSHSDQRLSEQQWQDYQVLCSRRQQGEPFAYLVGYKEFWSREFAVNQHTLIPRPETELLVELTLEKLPALEALKIVDLGVGSGAIAITLALERPNWFIIGTDISEKTLSVARHNKVKHNANNLNLLYSNWFEQLPQEKFDAIVSNPPYIARLDSHLQDLNYEPIGALVSGEEGLDAIKEIINKAPLYLKHNALLILEHGYDQAEKIQQLLMTTGYVAINSYADLSGNKRVTLGQWSNCK